MDQRNVEHIDKPHIEAQVIVDAATTGDISEGRKEYKAEDRAEDKAHVRQNTRQNTRYNRIKVQQKT